MAGAAIRLAGATDEAAVLNTLMLAFSADPIMRYMFPTAEAYVAGYLAFAAASGGAAIAGGTAWLAGDGAAALWLAPGVEADGAAIGAAGRAFAPADRPAPPA